MEVVDEQMRAYYDRRASEYDDWWLGTGLFEERNRPGWSEEVRHLTDILEALPAAHTLDVACGTGFLTQYLPGEVVALDQSAEMVRIARARLPDVRVLQGDAVPLPFADAQFERLTTSHFYGHLLPDERVAFLEEARRVSAQLILVDSARRQDVDAEEWQERVLNDGTHHRVYKRFFDAPDLVTELGGGTVLHDGHWFVVVASAAAI
jgi:demethylmenaquinone methyltransferase/2-methoxy-6-polyprenyl-1,4-benzoquinol methylase